VSHSARLADYRAALTAPGAAIPVAMGLLARIPVAMVGLALLLYVQRETGSFATAGLVAAGALVGVGTGAVAQGRIMDRLGATVPLLVTTGLFALTTTGGVLAVETHQPTPVLVVLGVAMGLTEPVVASVSRALWTHLLPAGSVRLAGYAYEAISMEVCFVLGPALAGLLAAAPWAGTGVVLAGVCMVVGAVGFALAPAIRRMRPEREHSGGQLLGALASPGMRTVALAALGFGIVVGFVEVAVPAAATNADHPALGGVLLGVWSAASVVFGLAYGARPWPAPLSRRLPVLLAVFSVLVALLALPTSLLWLGVTMVVAGVWITPQATAHSAAIELVAPRGTVTEAFGWVITSVTFGLAAGQSLAGQLAEHVGVWSAFLAASGAGLVVAALVWWRRGTVTGADEPARELVSAGRSGS
jgi:MFS family permease